jgi:hypothetical protein
MLADWSDGVLSHHSVTPTLQWKTKDEDGEEDDDELLKPAVSG